MIRTFCLLLISCVFFSSPIRAEVHSVYTDVALDGCKLVAEAQEGEGEWATFLCAGHNGMAVYVTEADLRFSLGYGTKGQSQKSFRQFLSPFNTIGKKLEWRLKDGRVQATILRYYTETGSEGKKGQILVVSKVSRGQACHVAYVDALANKGANVLAQYAADYVAPDFNCALDEPVHLGRRGVSPF